MHCGFTPHLSTPMLTRFFPPFCAAVFFWAIAFSNVSAQTAPTHIGGTQHRGSPGHNAELIGTAIKLRTPMVIYKVECQHCEGFWIDRDGQLYRTYNDAQDAVGDTLPAGEYHAFPNLNDDRSYSSGSVTVYIR